MITRAEGELPALLRDDIDKAIAAERRRSEGQHWETAHARTRSRGRLVVAAGFATAFVATFAVMFFVADRTDRAAVETVAPAAEPQRAQEPAVDPIVDSTAADATSASEPPQGDIDTAAANGLSIGPVNPSPDGSISLANQPDLIPVVEDDAIVGYARATDVFFELVDPNVVWSGYYVFEADGVTPVGVVALGESFVPIEQNPAPPTSAPSRTPEGDSPLGE